jgi:hypothetical protein
MEKIKDKDNLNISESTNQIINNIKDKTTKIDEINRKNDSESDEIENNEDEEKEQTRKIKRKESDDIIPHSKKGNIEIKKLDDIKSKNGNFLLNE